MAPYRRSSSSAAKGSCSTAPSSGKSSSPPVVQSRVNQFFTAAPGSTSTGTSRSTVGSNPRPSPPAHPVTTAPVATDSTRKRTAAESRSTPPTTMASTVAPTRLLREDPADPIQDSSPYRSALVSTLSTRGTRPTSPASTPPRPPSSSPNKKKRARKRHAKSQSPGHSSTPSSPQRARSATRRPPSSPSLLPGRGGRATFSLPSSSAGRGHTGRIPEARRVRAPTLADATDEELAELDLAEDDDALVRRYAGWQRQRAAAAAESSRPPTAPSPTTDVVVAPPVAAPPPSTAPAPEDSPVRVGATPAPGPPDSDDETVAADNSEGNLIHRFVHQPTSTQDLRTATRGQATPGPPPDITPTMTQTNPYSAPALVPRRPIERRYEFRVLVPPSTQADVELRNALVQFFTKLRECDSTLVIHPWEDKENTTRQSGTRPWKSISSPSQIPTTMNGLKKYFPRAIPKTGGGHIYPSCHLGHTHSFSFIKDDLQWWFQQEQHGFWERQLQCESTYIVGWALYSTQSIHVPALRRALGDLLGFDVGIRWRTIQIDKAGPIPKEQLVKALHFEVNRANRRQAKQRLAQIYARDADSFPLGIKLRLVWPLSDLMNFATRTKVSALRLRQLQFCSNMRGMRTWELHTIDQPDDSTGLTLRQRLTAIKSHKDGFQLFHSVDPSHIGDAVQFTFHPNREEEARAMITGLIPYLRWTMAQEHPSMSPVERERFFSKALYRHFSRDALDRAVDAIWNPETMSVDSPADDYNGWIYDVGDSELDCSQFEAVPTPASSIPSSPRGPVVRPHDAAGDQDSISTLPQGQSLSSLASQSSAQSLPSVRRASQMSTQRSSPSVTPPSSLTPSTPPDQLLTSLHSMIDTFRSVIDLLPNTPAADAVRQQLASLPPGTSAAPPSSSSSAPPSSTAPATGSEH